MNKELLIKNMTENLPMLRKRLGLTQSDLAEKIGVSRGTIVSIETQKREMTWGVYLCLLLLFSKNEETNKLLDVLNVTNQEFETYLRER